MTWSSNLKSLLTVFVFTILAVPVSFVESYQCTLQQCQDTLCPGTIGVCTTSTGCFNQIQQFDTPSTFTDRIFKNKGCTSGTCSELVLSATLGDQRKFSFENHCCTSNECNKDDIKLSSSSSLNGVECTACYSEKAQSCSSVTTLKCTGKETKCIEVTGTSRSSLTLYGKGCATENACDLQQNVFNGIQIKTTCISPVSNNGNPTLKLISSAPIVLLLLKVLL
uniref:LY6/PLAUR domain containing 8 like n=1 Tax=Cricetulus griseus TaxID=10029 RepID=A0A8C2M4X7_CRIGR